MLRNLARFRKPTLNFIKNKQVISIIQTRKFFTNNRVSARKTLINEDRPFLSILKLLWKNCRSNLPADPNYIRTLDQHEYWGIIAYNANDCRKIIIKKIDPELGEIAGSLVAKAKYFEKIKLNNTFSSILSDKILHDQMVDLQTSWNARLKVLMKEKTISENVLINPSGDNVAIYNVNLIIKKFYNDVYELMPQEFKSAENIKINGFSRRFFCTMTNKNNVSNLEYDPFLKKYLKNLQFLSDRLNSVDESKLTLAKIKITDRWEIFSKMIPLSFSVVQKEVGEELGRVASKISSIAYQIAVAEEACMIWALIRQRHFIDTLLDAGDGWIEGIEKICIHKQNLSDDAIVALFNINNMLRKYYIDIHKLESKIDHDWSLIFRAAASTSSDYSTNPWYQEQKDYEFAESCKNKCFIGSKKG